MSKYRITSERLRQPTSNGVLLRVGFGDEPATNAELVSEASATLAEFGDVGGELALINGPASLPVAAVLVHHLSHRFGAIGVFDPKLQAYVVSVSHTPSFGSVGTLLPVAEVAVDE